MISVHALRFFGRVSVMTATFPSHALVSRVTLVSSSSVQPSTKRAPARDSSQGCSSCLPWLCLFLSSSEAFMVAVLARVREPPADLLRHTEGRENARHPSLVFHYDAPAQICDFNVH